MRNKWRRSRPNQALQPDRFAREILAFLTAVDALAAAERLAVGPQPINTLASQAAGISYHCICRY